MISGEHDKECERLRSLGIKRGLTRPGVYELARFQNDPPLRTMGAAVAA
jgi:hypothetical protein